MAQYADRGFTILGFPSGDFGNQEKANNKEIAEFCYNTYGVKFPMFAKSTVKGAAANPLFAALCERQRAGPALELPQVPDQPRRPSGRIVPE